MDKITKSRLGNDKSKEKLIKCMAGEVTKLFEKILDYSEVAVANEPQYRKLRSKILRLGNDCIRNVSKELELRYEISYIASIETIVEVIQK